MALAAFAALAQVGISSYEGYEQEQAAGVAQTAVKNQEQGEIEGYQHQLANAQQADTFDEQWMHLKQLSQTLYGIQQPSQNLTGAKPAPPAPGILQ